MIKHLINVTKSLLHERNKRTSRSPHWPTVEKNFKKANPTCAACGSSTLIQVHHEKPFHLHPELELEPGNLISLCMSKNECHLILGHGDNFKAYNPDIRADAEEVRDHPGRLWYVAARAKTRRQME
jgi:5-methylcytosine-specific restriction protein A